MQKHDPALELEVLQFLQEAAQVCDLLIAMSACLSRNNDPNSYFVRLLGD